jgi:peptidase E
MFLAGGGSPEQEARVWAEAFEGISRVCYWPFAMAGDRLTDADRWIRESLLALGLEADVDTWPKLEGHNTGELREFDLLFVGGGLTSRLASEIARNGWNDSVRQFISGGGRYLGGSAGAILPCEEITLASLVEEDPAALGMSGLRVLAGLSVFPHADRYTPAQHRAVAGTLGHIVVCIPEASGVAVADGELRAIGPDPVTILDGRERTTLIAGETAPLPRGSE